MKKTILILIGVLTLSIIDLSGQTKDSVITPKPATKWFDKISLRGYVQLRYNRLLETNPDLKCEQCDKSWGDKGGLFLRRIRIVFSGKLNDYVSFYIQPDFASSPGGTTLNFGQIRDAYVDLFLDKKNEYRFRLGQSKMPFGFMNMQSSQNRLPLDRDDALNSALPNERDIGVIFSWAPAAKRKLFAELANTTMKGSGDYGVLSFGVYNGQIANISEANNELNWVARATYPIEFKMGNGTQIIEPGIQAYGGHYVLPSKTAAVSANTDLQYADHRVAGTFVLYPNPIGINLEYTAGKGPRYDKITNSISEDDTKGGYALISYRINTKKELTIFPFIRYQEYDGGKKQELDARAYNVKELEIGIEWQITKAFEIVTQYTISERRFEDGVKKDNLQKGNLLRLQAQLNF